MSLENALNQLEILNGRYKTKEFNEADTRFQIIDKIITKVFFWPDQNVSTEKHNNEGYIDYLLESNEKPIFVIEAKKTKIKFNFNQYSEITNHRVKVKVLMKNENTKATIEQVRQYSYDVGCHYACITNGHEWAFFETYIDGKSWTDGKAFIISSLQDFIDNFAEINKYLTYTKIVREHSFNSIFKGSGHSVIERYEPKLKINGYSEQTNNNKFEKIVRGYFEKYFGEMRLGDRELLEECYVSEVGYTVNFDMVTEILEDALSPYMKDEKNLQDIIIDAEGNSTFGKEVLNFIVQEKKSRVLVLFGGKGAGKSTFLVNLFSNKKNKHLKEYTRIGYVNLLKIANDKKAVKEEIFIQLIKKLDVDKLLDAGNIELMELFRDRFDIERRQALDGLDEKGDTFKLKRNEILHGYKKDPFYCLIRLTEHLRNKKKAVIINIDNTDQLDQDIQDYCFSLAQELSDKLHCISILSLREEKYTSSNIHGFLDAYEQNGFHISSPNPQQVFLKRLKFIQNKIENEEKILFKTRKKISIFFNILFENLEDEKSELNRFMAAVTHGNIRQGLELFKNYIFSNYTNFDEMVKHGSWNIKLHQVLKPIMIPKYRFYNEKVPNSIANIYRLRSENSSSHFTALRILNKLAIRNSEYVSIHEMKALFVGILSMEDDFKANLDLLLRRGMVESENGFEEYSEDLQKIKISSFGYYMQDVIYKDFTYLELITADLTVLDQQFSNEIIEHSNREYELLKLGQSKGTDTSEGRKIRYEILQVKIQKVEKLCNYLQIQELAEINYYGLSNNLTIYSAITANFKEQKRGIISKAKRNLGINPGKVEDRNGIPVIP